jgi:hypothetical protein
VVRPPRPSTPAAKSAWEELAESLSELLDTCDCTGREVHLHTSPDAQLFAAAFTHGPRCPDRLFNCLDHERSPQDQLLLDSIAHDGRLRRQSGLVQ